MVGIRGKTSPWFACFESPSASTASPGSAPLGCTSLIYPQTLQLGWTSCYQETMKITKKKMIYPQTLEEPVNLDEQSAWQNEIENECLPFALVSSFELS